MESSDKTVYCLSLLPVLYLRMLFSSSVVPSNDFCCYRMSGGGWYYSYGEYGFIKIIYEKAASTVKINWLWTNRMDKNKIATRQGCILHQRCS